MKRSGEVVHCINMPPLFYGPLIKRIEVLCGTFTLCWMYFMAGPHKRDSKLE